MPQYRIDPKDNQPVAGFIVQNTKAGEKAPLLMRAFVFSDQKEFYDYIGQLSKLYLNKLGILINTVSTFLIVVHENLSADVYVNDFEVVGEFRSKRAADAGELMRNSDIVDIRSLKFPGIQLAERDSIVFCWKVGWKFGLYFSFRSPDSSDTLDTSTLFKNLGQYHSYLTFQHVYDTLSNTPQFEKILTDGWFPFLALLPNQFKDLSAIYGDDFEVEERMKRWLSQFDRAWVENLSNKWWSNLFFEKKKAIIEAGIEAFTEGSPTGNINSIKNLYSEIEGLLQYFFLPKSKKKLKFRELVTAVREQAKSKSAGSYSLMFPEEFAKYLDSSFFRSFDLSSGQIDLSRHSTTHGVADSAAYNRVRALQGVLILDQIYFYL